MEDWSESLATESINGSSATGTGTQSAFASQPLGQRIKSVRPFVCQTCSKAFSRRSSLRRHMVTHTGIKPYACTYCPKRFTQSGHLLKHVRTRHVGMPLPSRNSHANAAAIIELPRHRQRFHGGIVPGSGNHPDHSMSPTTPQTGETAQLVNTDPIAPRSLPASVSWTMNRDLAQRRPFFGTEQQQQPRPHGPGAAPSQPEMLGYGFSGGARSSADLSRASSSSELAEDFIKDIADLQPLRTPEVKPYTGETPSDHSSPGLRVTRSVPQRPTIVSPLSQELIDIQAPGMGLPWLSDQRDPNLPQMAGPEAGGRGGAAQPGGGGGGEAGTTSSWSGDSSLVARLVPEKFQRTSPPLRNRSPVFRTTRHLGSGQLVRLPDGTLVYAQVADENLIAALSSNEAGNSARGSGAGGGDIALSIAQAGAGADLGSMLGGGVSAASDSTGGGSSDGVPVHSFLAEDENTSLQDLLAVRFGNQAQAPQVSSQGVLPIPDLYTNPSVDSLHSAAGSAGVVAPDAGIFGESSIGAAAPPPPPMLMEQMFADETQQGIAAAVAAAQEHREPDGGLQFGPGGA